MTNLRIVTQLAYYVGQPTSFAFSIIADRTPFQVVTRESLELGAGVDWSLVPYGEASHQLIRVNVPPGVLELSYEASVTVEPETDRSEHLDEVPFGDVPPDVLPYLTTSRYCESDKLGDFALRHFGHIAPGYSRVQAISDWVNGNLLYQPGSTDGSSGATDVLLQRVGVCRDYAHVAIALCRALGIPARYVSGYGLGVEPQDFHGFFEAYVGAGWYLFDPTGMAVHNALVRISHGRDAADTPFAILVGQAMLVNKWISVTVDGEVAATSAAVSTA